MSFPFVLLNVFLVFAVAMAVSCWGFALIPIWRAKMQTITCVPFLFGLVAAGWALSRGTSVAWSVVVLLGAAMVASMFLAFVYGWMRKGRFDQADVAAGIGRFGPVMVLWTCSLLYVAIATLVNASVSGSAIPFEGLVRGVH